MRSHFKKKKKKKTSLHCELIAHILKLSVQHFYCTVDLINVDFLSISCCSADSIKRAQQGYIIKSGTAVNTH